MNDFFNKKPINAHELGQTLCVVFLERLGGLQQVTRKELSDAWGKLIDVDETEDGFKLTLTKRTVTQPEKTNEFFDRAGRNSALKTTVQAS